MKGDQLKQQGRGEKNLIAVETYGNDIVIWNDHKPRFLKRLWNTIKSPFNKGYPEEETANNEINDIIDNVADGINERLRSPSLVNLERQANISKILAETRKMNLESDRLEIDNEKERMKAEKEKLLHSQEIIYRLIENGTIKISEKDGETLIVFDPANKHNLNL